MEGEKKGGRDALIVIIILLLIVNAVGGYYLYQGREDNKAITEEKTELSNQYIAVVADLNARQLALDTLKGRNAELDKVIGEMESRLDEQKGEILRLLRKNKLSKAELAETKQLLAALNIENDIFQARIDSVYRANRQLISHNERLEEDLEVERQIKVQLEEEKEVLTAKVELGKLLQPRELIAYGMKTRSNGKEQRTNNIKRLENIKICFDTGENKLLEPGELELFLRIINPKGETIVIESLGSGVLTSAETGEEVQYSRSFEFDYESANKTICILWSQNIFSVGEYTAEIYQDGYLLGQTSFVLKSGLR